MLNFTVKILLTLSIGTSCYLLSGCTLALKPDRDDTAITVPEFPPRNAYREIDLNQFDTNVFQAETKPEQVALAAFGIDENETEGNFTQEVTTENINPQQTIVMITQKNLPDDSVKDIHYRIDFEKTDAQWQIMWVGQQFICRSGRGSEVWSQELCI